MSDDLLSKMRMLRRRCDLLKQSLVDDYRPFLSRHDETTFFRLPTKPSPDQNDIGVTPTCTALMALCIGNRLSDFYGTGALQKRRLTQVVRKLVRSDWTTASLKQNNAFTTALVLRATAMLTHQKYIESELLRSVRRTKDRERHFDPLAGKWRQGKPIVRDPARTMSNKSLHDICRLLVQHSPEALAVQNYLPTSTIAYWVFDAVQMMGVRVTRKHAVRFVEWAAENLSRQVSLVSAGHQAMMDPIAMAMAACLCRALKRIAQSQDALRTTMVGSAPTDNELISAVRQFFAKQNEVGVWEKYFPLFHYPTAGANHCWHFEVLEAVFNEFPELLTEPETLDRINTSLDWLEKNRLEYRLRSEVFRGWNSGGDLTALKNGEPESWPTGVAHMCLCRLSAGLSTAIRDSVLDKYRDRVKLFNRKSSASWTRYLDSRLEQLDSKRNSVKKLLLAEVLKPTETAIQEQGAPAGTGDNSHPHLLTPTFQLSKRRSALLFGPPGTSKTSLAEAIAERLGWPFVELSPTDFLRGGMDGIYKQVNDVFEDLSDLYGVVILFDEMDALVQSREGGPDNGAGIAGSGQLDVTQKFLTTSMLPKLLKLRKQARTVFFMATNHQRDFDPAIKRAGRFDLLVPMGPPSLAEKKRGLEGVGWFQANENPTHRNRIRQLFRDFTDDPETAERLERFTYNEMTEFFEYLRRMHSSDDNLRTALASIREKGFALEVKLWASERIVLRDGSAQLFEFASDQKSVSLH